MDVIGNKNKACAVDDHIGFLVFSPWFSDKDIQDSMADVEETIRRIQSQKGVVGVVVMDSAGRTIRSTLDDESTAKYSTLLQQLCEKSKDVDSMADVEETIRRIQSQKGVVGVVVMDSAGRTIRSTLDDESTAKYSTLLQQLCEKSKDVVRELDGSNDLTFLQLRTKKNEIMIAPDRDYLLAVIENLS
ncbi:Roadblock/LC7 domain protein [Dictyocaulus viviparus]|uniref:Roadblock/LC7 domain protein n=1 Tax=Dictyocaulus viviparus TaxID=29172 RepID=A0A0D8Y8K0_DICVI|nr:Roadblock/LC7 domain protein [Dictyocaulus viviparus]